MRYFSDERSCIILNWCLYEVWAKTKQNYQFSQKYFINLQCSSPPPQSNSLWYQTVWKISRFRNTGGMPVHVLFWPRPAFCLYQNDNLLRWVNEKSHKWHVWRTVFGTSPRWCLSPKTLGFIKLSMPVQDNAFGLNNCLGPFLKLIILKFIVR